MNFLTAKSFKKAGNTRFFVWVALFAFFSFHSVSCGSFNGKAKRWFDNTKSEILRQSDLSPDSLGGDSVYVVFYYKGRKFNESRFYGGKKRFEAFSSRDGDFELRREVCENGTIRFEGILYQGFFYGPSKWFNCDGSLSDEGFRFKGEHIGKWEYWDSKLNSNYIEDHQRYSVVDSLPLITKQ
jgi:hypothetical protein